MVLVEGRHGDRTASRIIRASLIGIDQACTRVHGLVEETVIAACKVLLPVRSAALRFE